MSRNFEELPHTADIKVRVYGTTKPALFAHALKAMFQVMHPQIDTKNKNAPVTHTITINAIDETNLLVDFLSEALCLSDTYHEAYFKVDIETFSPTQLSATIYGNPITGFESSTIKAVTYNELVIAPSSKGWHADIVFDI
jgi:SHS2 domain-containing protein